MRLLCPRLSVLDFTEKQLPGLRYHIAKTYFLMDKNHLKLYKTIKKNRVHNINMCMYLNVKRIIPGLSFDKVYSPLEIIRVLYIQLIQRSTTSNQASNVLHC